jgi:hypothetical protein
MVIGHTQDIENGRVVIEGALVKSDDFSVFPSAPQYSYGVVRNVYGGYRKSQFVQGHSIYLIYHGHNSAYTNPLGIQFQE